MFNKILIANRGAIAVRIIRTLKKMGIISVAVYSEADKNSLHVRHADEAYSLGDGPASQTYLNEEKLFSIVSKSKAQALHPGYGFLSENSSFVDACEAKGVAFIGPTAQQMQMFGLKHTARLLAEQRGVPLLSGSPLLNTVEDAKAAAQLMTYPIMLKSTAGGGGIGMQVCYDETSLESCFDSVKRLSGNNFSNDGVFVEKYIEYARHIEVQVFGDGKGNVITLGERDCSTQRRHQKVIEETPAPNLSDELRQQLSLVSKQLMSAVNYRNAGTVEYIFDQTTQSFCFLEVNTRLQVEHGITELIYGVDLVEWMVQLSADEFDYDKALKRIHSPEGHAVQARIYAENPHKNFQPCAGLLSHVSFPAIEKNNKNIRIDHWIETGLDVSSFFDPMLAKVMVHAKNREKAIAGLDSILSKTIIEGIETNKSYVKGILKTQAFCDGSIHTRYLNSYKYTPCTIDILDGGTQTTIQDFPGRSGYWDVGVPPSGPFDNVSFQLGNKLLSNDANVAGLEVTLVGPIIQFNMDTQICLTGAQFDTKIDDVEISFNQPIDVCAGQILNVGKPTAQGARCYLTFLNGLKSTPYLGSRSTFTLGQFGGFSGRALRAGDVLHLCNQSANDSVTRNASSSKNPVYPERSVSTYIANFLDSDVFIIRVIYGPHGAPDFFTYDDIATFFQSNWEVHYNSSRTGIRLIGPKPEWARSDGGEAGMHPSNIHDNAYAVGAIDFTGDMPVILGPDGPSLGGFVCPATVISADLWKLGQLKAGDKVRFDPVSLCKANSIERDLKSAIKNLGFDVFQNEKLKNKDAESKPLSKLSLVSPLCYQCVVPDSYNAKGIKVVYRAAGDHYLLVEYGEQELDIRLRFRAHALMLSLKDKKITGVRELTPGIRSLQIHYNSLTISTKELIVELIASEHDLKNLEEMTVPSRIVHIPLSWNDKACRLAIEKYMQSVRKNAPWCPDNIEFIRRINGLDSVEDVKKTVFDASYVVMGLGDVYLGAPVATPLDPRHRLVTTKYNPARTWTAENSVGIGGSYLCVYGMEGPGGYQFIGRTLQMWNRTHKTKEFNQPWLLRFFDQIRFYEVDDEELLDIREKFPRGDYSIRIEEASFSLKQYQKFVDENQSSIDSFTENRNQAFSEELHRWVESGQIHFTTEQHDNVEDDDNLLPENCVAIESHVAGNIWQLNVKEGDRVKTGDVVGVLESMKMEIDVTSLFSGKIKTIVRQQGQQVLAGQNILIVEKD